MHNLNKLRSTTDVYGHHTMLVLVQRNSSINNECKYEMEAGTLILKEFFW